MEGEKGREDFLKSNSSGEMQFLFYFYAEQRRAC